MRRLLILLLTAVPLLAQAQSGAAAGAEKKLEGSLDLGYRWVSDVAGSRDTYRSVVDLNSGFRVLGLDFRMKDPKRKLFDEMTVSADNWGDPYNSLHVDAQRDQTYRVRFDYRNMAYFSALPSFANPRLGAGILSSERSFDLHRKLYSVDVEFRPGTKIIPYFGFARDAGDGNGVIPFVATGNEYPVATRYQDWNNDYRGGVRFQYKRWYLTLEQGGLKYGDGQKVQASGLNAGNRTQPLLGRDLFVNSALQGYDIQGNSIYSRAVFTAEPASWAHLNGQFLFSQPESNVRYDETASGLLYLGGTTFADATRASGIGLAKRPRVSGSFNAEIRPHARVRIYESIMTDRLHGDSSLLWDSTPPTGAAGISGAVNLFDRLVRNYSRQQVDGLFDVTRKLMLRGGYRYEWGDAEVRMPDLSFVPGPKTGSLERHVGLFAVNFRPIRNFVINLDYEGSKGDQSYFRTSLRNYHKMRARSRFQIRDSLQANLGFQYFTNDNPSAGSGYQFRNLLATGSLRWQPGGGHHVSVLADYMYSALKSDILILLPPFFSPALSAYRDNGHTVSTLVEIHLPSTGAGPGEISLGGSFYRSSGSRPTRYWQPVGRVLVPFHKHVAVFAEWRYYGLTQIFYSFEGFRTHTATFGLRFSL